MYYEETCHFKALGRILLAACDLIPNNKKREQQDVQTGFVWAFKQLQGLPYKDITAMVLQSLMWCFGQDRRACVRPWIYGRNSKKIKCAMRIVQKSSNPGLWSSRNDKLHLSFFVNVHAFIWMNSDVCFVFRIFHLFC
jgi:hypothetical protein